MKKQEIMEQNKEEYYFNSKNYDSKGRRIGVIGREINGKLEIFELVCSLSDSFKKSLVKSIHSYFTVKISNPGGNDISVFEKEIEKFKSKYHPNIYTIDIKEGDSAKFTFDTHCRNNYYHKVIQLRRHEYEETVLIKNNAKTISLNNKRLYKMY